MTARLREAGALAVLNHLLHFYRGQVPFESYLQLLDGVDGLEVRNGTMLPAHNVLSEAIAAQWEPSPGRPRLAAIGGSDAHTLRRVGSTWTVAPGRTKEEFLRNLKCGLGEAGGRHGGTAAVAGDAYGVIGSYIGALAGFGPRDLPPWRRAACLGFAAVSLPFQFMPFAVAASRKFAERREVDRARLRLAPGPAAVTAGARA